MSFLLCSNTYYRKLTHRYPRSSADHTRAVIHPVTGVKGNLPLSHTPEQLITHLHPHRLRVRRYGSPHHLLFHPTPNPSNRAHRPRRRQPQGLPRCDPAKPPGRRHPDPHRRHLRRQRPLGAQRLRRGLTLHGRTEPPRRAGRDGKGPVRRHALPQQHGARVLVGRAAGEANRSAEGGMEQAARGADGEGERFEPRMGGCAAG